MEFVRGLGLGILVYSLGLHGDGVLGLGRNGYGLGLSETVVMLQKACH